MRKIWNQESSDIMRFELTREQWDNLISALWASAAWANNREVSDRVFKTIDSLRNAEMWEPDPAEKI